MVSKDASDSCLWFWLLPVTIMHLETFFLEGVAKPGLQNIQ